MLWSIYFLLAKQRWNHTIWHISHLSNILNVPKKKKYKTVSKFTKEWQNCHIELITLTYRSHVLHVLQNLSLLEEKVIHKKNQTYHTNHTHHTKVGKKNTFTCFSSMLWISHISLWLWYYKSNRHACRCPLLWSWPFGGVSSVKEPPRLV